MVDGGEHVQEVGKRSLEETKNHVTEQYLATAYYALFYSHLSYGLILWPKGGGHAISCK